MHRGNKESREALGRKARRELRIGGAERKV